jgi:hypothetical protein
LEHLTIQRLKFSVFSPDALQYLIKIEESLVKARDGPVGRLRNDTYLIITKEEDGQTANKVDGPH